MSLVQATRTLGWVLLALATFSAWGHARQLPTTKTLTVLVADGLSGAPIVGAPVQQIGDPYLQTTDASGKVTFSQIPLSAESVRLWTTPTGYSPGFREVTLPSQVNFAILTPVPEDRFTTGLIPAATGGSYVLSGTVGPDMGDFYMEIVVPPNALSQDASISITPYPCGAVGKQGTDPSSLPFAGFHANLRNNRGAKIRETFAAPITIKLKGWQLGHSDDYDDVNPDWVTLYRYDYLTHEFAEEPTTLSIDSANDLVVFDVSRLSVYTDKFIPPVDSEDLQNFWDWLWGDEDDDGIPPGEGDPPPPEVEVDGPAYICTPMPANHTITCGKFDTTKYVTIAKGTTVGVSAELQAGIKNTFGVEGGVGVAAKIKDEVEVFANATFGSTLSITTSIDVEGGFPCGGETGGSCYSGTAKLYIIYQRYTVSAGGLTLGDIDIPVDVQTIRHLAWDTNCGSHCLELPFGMPIDDKLPCD